MHLSIGPFWAVSMSILIKVSDTVRFPVEGKLRDDTGTEKDFAFDLVMRRLNQDEFDAVLVDPNAKVSDIVKSNATGWHCVKAEDGVEVPFSAAGLTGLLLIPGMTTLVWVAYCKNAGVQAKNSERSSV